MKVWLGTLFAAVVVIAGFAASAMAAPGITANFFTLKGSNGYEIEVSEVQEGDFPPEAGVTAHRSAETASYTVPAELTRAQRAVFGDLGSFNLHFHRGKRTVNEMEKGCTWITEAGLFRGRFSFHGEGDYTAVEATSIPGKVLRLPDGFCGFGGEDRVPRPQAAPNNFLFTPRFTARAALPNGYLQLDASPEIAGRGSAFAASSRELVGAMKIDRRTIVGSKATLDLKPGADRNRSVDLAPPAPFSGSAHFEEAAAGPAAWTGDLAVPLPGAGMVGLTGPGFTARICPHVYITKACRVTPRATASSQR